MRGLLTLVVLGFLNGAACAQDVSVMNTDQPPAVFGYDSQIVFTSQPQQKLFAVAVKSKCNPLFEEGLTYSQVTNRNPSAHQVVSGGSIGVQGVTGSSITINGSSQTSEDVTKPTQETTPQITCRVTIYIKSTYKDK